MLRLPPDVTALTVALVLFASGTHGAEKWPRSGVRICERVQDSHGHCYGTQMDYCFWTDPAPWHSNNMACYDCQDTLEKCQAKAVKENKKDSDYVCNYDTSVSGTADILLSNGKTDDTGYSSKSCDVECSSNSACKSFVFRPMNGYVVYFSAPL